MILNNVYRRFALVRETYCYINRSVVFSYNYNIRRENHRNLSFSSSKTIDVLNSEKYFICPFNKQTVRHKKTKRSKKHNTDSDDDDDNDDDEFSDIEDDDVTKNSKIMIINLTSLRIDGVLKSALGVSRNKIDKYFYESKLRKNGQKVLKKALTTEIGDEIDLIKGPCPINPNNIIVSRVEILDAKGKEEKIVMKVNRFKSLTIENYKDAWKASIS